MPSPHAGSIKRVFAGNRLPWITSSRSQMNPATSGGVKNCPNSRLRSKSSAGASAEARDCRDVGFSLSGVAFILEHHQAGQKRTNGQQPSAGSVAPVHLPVNLPPPNGPPVDPEGGAGDEEAAVVMIPDRRDKGEAWQFAPEPNVLVVGGWVEIDVVPRVAGGAANRPVERGEEFPPGKDAPPGQHPVLRSAEEHSVQNGGLPPPSGAIVRSN